MTDNEMIAMLAAFFLEEFSNDAISIGKMLDLSDDKLKQLTEFAEAKAAL